LLVTAEHWGGYESFSCYTRAKKDRFTIEAYNNGAEFELRIDGGYANAFLLAKFSNSELDFYLDFEGE